MSAVSCFGGFGTIVISIGMIALIMLAYWVGKRSGDVFFTCQDATCVNNGKRLSVLDIHCPSCHQGVIGLEVPK